MEPSRQELFFLAIRMQAGAIRRELPALGLGDRAAGVVLQALDLMEAQVRQWSIDGMVAPAQLQDLLGALMRLPQDLREVVAAGKADAISMEILAAFGVLPTWGAGPAGGAPS